MHKLPQNAKGKSVAYCVFNPGTSICFPKAVRVVPEVVWSFLLHVSKAVRSDLETEECRRQFLEVLGPAKEFKDLVNRVRYKLPLG